MKVSVVTFGQKLKNKTMLVSVCPKLPMRDKSVTKDYYINKLGFQEMSDYCNYIIFKKDEIELHFFEFKEFNILENYGQVYIRTKGIEKIYQTFLDKEVIHPNGYLETKPWGQKEFSVLDLDNNLLTFGEQINLEL